MSKNPWNLPRLETYIGTEETASLEFKSSRGLMDPKEHSKAIESICQDVSGFLNGDGGVILIGLDEGQRQERPDTATGLSVGVPRSILNASRLESMICDHIHPSVAGLVKLFPIPVGGSSENPLLAYAVEIRSGITAYQAPDKKYYVRRGYSSQAMEDKDIRLRMLNNQVARARIGLRLDHNGMIEKLKKIGGGNAVRSDSAVLVEIINVGLKTIRYCSLRATLRIDRDGTTELAQMAKDTDRSLEFRCTWPEDDSNRHAIHPEDTKLIPIGSIAIDRDLMQTPPHVTAHLVCYLEDAPAVTHSEDMSLAYLEACDALSRLSQETTTSYLREFTDRVEETTFIDPDN